MLYNLFLPGEMTIRRPRRPLPGGGPRLGRCPRRQSYPKSAQVPLNKRWFIKEILKT